ncbi:DUF6445 family protein [Paraglaciecola sp. L3A3]|uniref:DUF6445 family protein n=1 Tax=Paraglaciecola sp. L3A3 TaxID=2686358 RepID=UPI00131A79DD|nr:DUF6445 family protein [Paraglaciecola sp. L3A3]
MESNLKLTINPNFRHQMLQVGVEKTRVFVIDDFLLDLNPLLNNAHQKTCFSPEKVTAYPGIRTELPVAYTELVGDFLKPLFERVYQVPSELNYRLKAGKYSQISLIEDELEEKHCLPHYDSVNPHYFAVLHYINPGEFGGTSFYHHKPTGFENIYQSRKVEYLQSVTDHLKAHSGTFYQQYFVKSDGHFDCSGTIGYQQNRMLVYPGSLLHSAVINPVNDISSNVKVGRLTANMFIDFEK